MTNENLKLFLSNDPGSLPLNELEAELVDVDGAVIPGYIVQGVRNSDGHTIMQFIKAGQSDL